MYIGDGLQNAEVVKNGIFNPGFMTSVSTYKFSGWTRRASLNMLTEITCLLDEKKYDIIAIECEDLSSPAFLQLCIIDYAIKKNVKVIYVSTTRSTLAFKFVNFFLCVQ